MYKVLFAEDELLVRLGLQSSIPWSKYEMEVVALAENGLEAYKLFEEIHPDILITDLRMEGMDGLELVKRVREVDKECAIVVISCLNDFETLRKLIPYNINAYVLKASISIDEVCSVLAQTKSYLKSIGRTAKNNKEDSEKLEEKISKYLMGDVSGNIEENLDYLEHLLLFSLEDENKDKINDLAMEFIYELVNRQIPGEILVPLKDKEFCVFYKSTDTSLSSEMVSNELLSEDALSRHEQRSNLYSYLGQKDFSPVISGKIKLFDTDILILYTKGIWENVSEGEIDKIFENSGKDPSECLGEVETALLDKNRKYIDNYTIAGIYIDKVFIESDTKKKRRRKLILIGSIAAVVLILATVIAIYFYTRYRKELKEDMDTHYDKMLKFIEMENYKKADTECEESIKKAEGLRDKDMKELLYHYEQVIEGILEADEKYDAESYSEAKSLYKLVLDEIPYEDNAGLSYVKGKLD
ncbi:MAG: response regulator, partial [Lachnoanaerobaculum sp.]|nr:response regulator [Lachnoanaerobaculum sp.]